MAKKIEINREVSNGSESEDNSGAINILEKHTLFTSSFCLKVFATRE